MKNIADLKSKVAVKNRVYTEVNPIIRGVFRNELYWKPIKDMVEHLRNIGVDVVIAPSNTRGCSGGYHYDGKYKEYDITCKVNNHTLAGTLTACFCGSVQAPTEDYDLSLVLW